MSGFRAIGVISAEDAVAWGLSGPSLRGSGVAWDLRKANPYTGYDEFEFDVPTGTKGDVYDRFLCRMEEMKQSQRILVQALKNVPGGPVMTSDRKIAPPPRAELDTSMESLIHHFKLFTEGYHPPIGESYAAVESARGEKATISTATAPTSLPASKSKGRRSTICRPSRNGRRPYDR